MKHRQASRPARALLLFLSVLLAIPAPGFAQVVKPLSTLRGEQEQLLEMRWSDAPLTVVLDHYADITGRTLIMSPGVPQVLISLKSKEKLSETEFLNAIESVLAMNNVALVPLGDKFLKVVPSAELGMHGEDVTVGVPGPDEPDTDQMDSRIIELKYLELEEVQPIIDSLKHAYAKVLPLPRNNAFKITDTVVNIRQIAEVIEYLDKPSVTKVETRIYELQHAEAGEVAGRLNELIQESQQETSQPRRTPTNVASTGTRGVVRAGTTAAQQAAAAAAARQAALQPQSALDLAERGIIQGEVKIVSDDRTNILIIISEPPNFAFFDKIVTILDKPVDPDIAVEVVALEYADAEEISGILNDFVGAATAESQSARGSSRTASQEGTDTNARATALRDFIARRQTTTAVRSTAGATDLSEGVGRLSEDTRILADERTNSILLMGRRTDIEILKTIVDELDVMLAQVMIEAVIIEVTLNDDLQFGLDWLQRSYEVFNEERIGPNNSFALREPVFAFGGGQDFRDGEPFIDGSQVTRATALSPGALTYYATFFDLNLDVVMRLARTSSDAKILQTPVVVTTDNTEARIIVGESRPVVTSTSTTAGGVGRNTFQYQDIGIELTVTPRINPQKFVVMEINQTADNVGGFEVIDGNNVPVITRRELEAQIAVENRSSIVLGGLIGSEARKAVTKIPVLGDIPLLGNLFRSKDNSDDRTELLVIITPYVMSTPEEVRAETRRLNSRSLSGEKWGHTWSDSPLINHPELLESEAPAPLLDRMVEEVREEQAVRPEGLLARLAEEEEMDPELLEEIEPDPIEEALREVREQTEQGSLDAPVPAEPMPMVDEPRMEEPVERPVPDEDLVPPTPLSRREATPPAEVASPREDLDLAARARAATESPREALKPAVPAAAPVRAVLPVRRPALPTPVAAQPAPPVVEPIEVPPAEAPIEDVVADVEPVVAAPAGATDVAVTEEPVAEVAEMVEVDEPPPALPVVIEEAPVEVLVEEPADLYAPVLRTSVEEAPEELAEPGDAAVTPTPAKKRRGFFSRLFGGKSEPAAEPVEVTEDVLEEGVVEAVAEVTEEAVEPVAEAVRAVVEPTMVVASNIPRRSLFSARKMPPRDEGIPADDGEWKPVPVAGRPAPAAVDPEPVAERVEPEAPEPAVVVEEPPSEPAPRVVVPDRPARPVRVVTPVERVEPARIEEPPVVAAPVDAPRAVAVEEPAVRAAIPDQPGRAVEPAPAAVAAPAVEESAAVQRDRMLAELQAVIQDAAPEAPAPAVAPPPAENGEHAPAPLTPASPASPRRFTLPGRNPVVVPAPAPARAAPPVAAPAPNVDDTEAPPPLK